MTVTCPYCTKPAKLVKGNYIYPRRADLKDKKFWRCDPCGAYVGCHDGTDNPLGRLADAELRKAKMAAHSAFDPIWRCEAPDDRRRKRSEAYAWLSREMGLPPSETHIGMMDVAQCRQVVELCIKLHRSGTAARATAEWF